MPVWLFAAAAVGAVAAWRLIDRAMDKAAADLEAVDAKRKPVEVPAGKLVKGPDGVYRPE
jgi:hypothetical protein